MRASLISPLLLLALACGGPGTPTVDGGPPDAGGGDAGAVDAGGTACGAGVTARPGTVITSTGAVTGSKSGEVWAWKGIPYAEPPVGALRWRAPAPKACWSGELVTQAFGPMCPQPESDGGVSGEEDCLTLNLWAREGLSGAPVLVFIHGGGNTQGSGSEGFYDGVELAARQGAVVVTFNYRLGALGFLNHAALDAESDAGVSGNYGLLDQGAALRWVQANVARFGGDPAKVLLFGESAGGQNTLLHVVSPASAGLFSAAMVESGGTYDVTMAEGHLEMQQVVEAVACHTAADVAACLRGVSAEALVKVPTAIGPLSRGLHYRPVIDGVLIPDEPMVMLEQGRFNKAPFAIGSNADETSRMVTPVQTELEYAATVRSMYGATLGNQLLTQYPASRFNTPRQALIRLTTDATWTCPTRRIARAVARNQTQPVYRYFFTWRPPGAAGLVSGSTHGIELPFVFRTFAAFGWSPAADDTALSDAMQRAWAQLAATGTPSTGASVAWPPYAPVLDTTLELNTPLAVLQGVRTDDCDLIDSLLP